MAGDLVGSDRVSGPAVIAPRRSSAPERRSPPGWPNWPGLASFLAMCLATAMTFASAPVINTVGQLLLKVACLATIVIGVRRFRPAAAGFWWALVCYFAFASIRNVARVLVAVTQNNWTFLVGSTYELVWNALAGASLAAATLLLLRSRRPRGDWAIADAWVLTAALLLTMVQLTSIPLERKFGFGIPFWNVGVVSVMRDTMVLVPIVALAYSERIRSTLITLVGAAVALMTVCSLAYNSVGANLATSSVLSSAAVVVLSGLQSVAQVIFSGAALLPAMTSLTRFTSFERPPWGWRRTSVLVVVVLMPVAATIRTGRLTTSELAVVMVGYAIVLLVSVARLRQAVTAANRSLNSVSFLAMHDDLTGLENRRSWHRKAIPALTEHLVREGELALSCCYLNVDDLKGVNDRVSHAAGDQLLVEVARAVERAVADEPSGVFRFGGDEFLAVSILNPRTAAGEADRIGRKVADAVNHSMSGSRQDESGASIGSSWLRLEATAGPAERQIDHLLQQADLAQVAAKRSGGRRIRFYDEELGRRARRDRMIAGDVRSAWAAGQMSLVYQPVVSLNDFSVYGAESLLRWRHPHLGAVPPPEAIQAAEDLGTIEDLGLDILRRALAELAGSARRSGSKIGVNLSAQQLTPGAIGRLLELIEASGQAKRLWLEVTEQMLVQERSRVAGALNELRSAGVLVALDDFGTGYCGLDYLCTIPVDIVKLDGIFARHSDSETRRKIARLGAQLADAIGAATLAEGIESFETARVMQDLGFTYGQGYAFRRPTASLDEALDPVLTPRLEV